MKTLLLLVCLLGATFSNLTAKERIKHNATETVCITDSAQESITTNVAFKPERGSSKRRTLHTGLIMMGSGIVGTVTGVALTGNGYANENATTMAIGLGLTLLGVGSSLSGAVVTIVGLALPRN